MIFSFGQKIWLYRTPIDFRRQIDGIVILIAAELKREATSGELFIFRNRSSNKIKLLWWDNNGFWLSYKRLERSRFIFPAVTNECMTMTSEQLQLLLAGINFEKQFSFPKVEANKFY